VAREDRRRPVALRSRDQDGAVGAAAVERGLVAAGGGLGQGGEVRRAIRIEVGEHRRGGARDRGVSRGAAEHRGGVHGDAQVRQAARGARRVRRMRPDLAERDLDPLPHGIGVALIRACLRRRQRGDDRGYENELHPASLSPADLGEKGLPAHSF
jgi:hypothetical protein